MKNKSVNNLAGGGGPAEPVLSKQSVLTDGVKATAKGEKPAEPVLCLDGGLSVKKCAFTMAEILLSLTIIGVVAAITLPSLTGNINERTWNTQRKALYARFSQAVALMPALNGYGTLTEDASGSLTEDNVAETFITAGLSKVLKINNVCDNEHLTDCGLPASYTNLLGSNSQMPLKMSELNSNLISYSASGYSNTYSGIDTKAAAFETQNGESILLFYNPGCVSNMNETSWYFSQPKICVNMVYDLNGSKGPNTVGKDMGVMTILYPTDSVVVAPMPYNRRIDGVLSENAANACTVQAGDDYRIPTKDELASLFANKDIIGSSLIAGHMFSSSKFVSPTFGVVNWLILSTGEYRTPDSTTAWSIVCVKRN